MSGPRARPGLLLLDVDGPLNPWAAKPTKRPEGYETHRLRPRGWEHAKRPLRVWLNPRHGRLLLDLAGDTGLELVWATTWEHDANTFISPRVGLPELSVIDFSRHPDTRRGWKYPAVLEYAADRPVVWLDDEFEEPRFVGYRSEFESLRGRCPTLLRQVSPGVGLTGQDLAAVRVWAGALHSLGT